MKPILNYFPLEGYKSRYTELMSCPGGWMESKFSETFNVRSFRPEEQDLVVIRKGEVLDAYRRPIYAMKQVIAYLESLPDSSRLYVDDFFHPGIEAIPYALRANTPIYTFCWAQTFDRHDFTATVPSIAKWMRAWEYMGLSVYSKVFVASELLRELIVTAIPSAEDQVVYVGLPFDSVSVQKQVEQSSLVPEQFDVVFSSRLDKEKQFGFFCALAEKLGSKYRFAVSTAFDEMRGTDVAGIAHAKELVEKGKLTVFTGMSKPDYYMLLSNTKVQMNTALQDWVSFTLLEALTFGCLPLYPRYRDFKNVFSEAHDFTYTAFNLDSAARQLTYLLNDKSPINPAPLSDILAHHDNTISRIAAEVR